MGLSEMSFHSDFLVIFVAFSLMAASSPVIKCPQVHLLLLSCQYENPLCPSALRLKLFNVVCES
jgi:hypothetical protein